MRKRSALLAVAAVLSVAPALPAQEEEEDDGPSEAPASNVVEGTNEAVGYCTRAGMTFELRGARLVVPPNLPVGQSRRTTFAFSREALSAESVAPGFRRAGSVMRFDGAFDASSSPVVVSLRMARSPARPDQRLVLAMEQAAMCTGANQTPLAGGAPGLCSSWELLDARHENGDLVGEMRAPGGFRLVFGTVPIPVTDP